MNNEYETFQYLNNNLTNSNKLISIQSIASYKSLEKKLSDPVSQYRTSLWYPKAMLLKKVSQNAVTKLDSLKNNLELLNETSIKDSVFEILVTLQESISNIDKEIKTVFEKEIILLTSSKNEANSTKQSFINKYFESNSAQHNLTLLSKFQNDILILENKIVTFFDVQTMAGCNLSYERFSVLISQNTNHLKSGESLEVYAGIGSFSLAPAPKININGTNLKIGEDGLSVYQIKATGETGKHSIPVKVEYIDPTGQKITRIFEVNYYIDK